MRNDEVQIRKEIPKLAAELKF